MIIFRIVNYLQAKINYWELLYALEYEMVMNFNDRIS